MTLYLFLKEVNMAEKIRFKDKVKGWIYDHQDDIAKGAGFALTMAMFVGPALARRSRRIRKEEDRISNYIYDPRSRIFFKTKKRSNNMNIIIAQRLDDGEPLYRILSDLKLLK